MQTPPNPSSSSKKLRPSPNMASLQIHPSNYSFPVNWTLCCNRCSVRGGPLLFHPPLRPPPPPKNSTSSGNKLPTGTTTSATRLNQQDSLVSLAPSKLLLRFRFSPVDGLTDDKIAMLNCHPPHEVIVDDQKASFTANDAGRSCQKASPDNTAALDGCRFETGDPLFALAEEAARKKGKKRKFSLLLSEEHIEQDISGEKKLAGQRSSEGKHQRRKSSSKRKAGLWFRLSEEEAEQNVLLVKEGKKRDPRPVRTSRLMLIGSSSAAAQT